jgi:hypothetical protein
MWCVGDLAIVSDSVDAGERVQIDKVEHSTSGDLPDFVCFHRREYAFGISVIEHFLEGFGVFLSPGDEHWLIDGELNRFGERSNCHGDCDRDREERSFHVLGVMSSENPSVQQLTSLAFFSGREAAERARLLE